MNITLQEAAAACRGKLFGDGGMITGVTRDSRTVRPGDLFLCIKGANADGHDYAGKAFAAGAACCLAERPVKGGAYILVDSVLDSVRYLASYYRSTLNIPIVGIVGSVGKTTAKEMTSAVLSVKYNVCKTPENLNNELGVPLTVMSIGPEHTAAVIEMGISDFGEMSRLAEIVRPQICVLTSIGYCHLENLIDLNGVMRAKGEVFDYMPKNGVAVLNGDDSILNAYSPKIKKITYGLSAGCDIVGEDVVSLGLAGSDFVVASSNGRFRAHTGAYGVHTVTAALAASAVGYLMGLTGEQIAQGIGRYKTVGGRAAVINTGAITVINDCYNANPNSVKAGILSLTAASGRKTAVLGDMLELGGASPALHRSVGVFAAENGIDLLLCCGAEGKYIYDGYRSAGGGESAYFDSKEQLAEKLPQYLKKGDTVLVKASHGMGFDYIVNYLENLAL